MSLSPETQEAIRQATRTCTTNQSMIDLTSKHLDELRTQCASTDKITQKEIKDAESKLIRMVGNQLVAKQKLNVEMPEALKEYPKLELWLRIVGIPEEAIKNILEEGLSFMDLLNMAKDTLTSLLQKFDCLDQEVKTLLTAFQNLRACTEKQMLGENTSEHDWHFTDLACLQAAAVAATAASRSTNNSPALGNSPKHQPRTASSSTSSATSVSSVEISSSSTVKADTLGGRHTPMAMNNMGDLPPPRSTPSSPVPSPHKTATGNMGMPYNGSPLPPRSKSVSSAVVKFPQPPPSKKNYMLYPDTSITKSSSHESQLANKVVDIDPVKSNKKKPQNIKLSGSHEVLFRRRLSTDGSEAGSRGPSGHTSPVISSPIRSPPYKHDQNAVLIDDHSSKYSNTHTLPLPKSPKTPLKLHHDICHRFANTFKITTCDFCHKQMILGCKCKDCKFTSSMFVLAPCDLCVTFAIRGKACKTCKKKFHKDCAQRAPHTCGLSDEHVDALLDWSESPMSQRRMTKQNILSHNNQWDREEIQGLKNVKSMPLFHGGPLPDSGSNTSSCNSSSPSSPAYPQTSSDTITSPSPIQSPVPPHYNSLNYHTQFNFPDIASSLPAVLGRNIGRGSPDTDVVSTNTSNDSDKTLIDSNTSEHTLADRVDSVDSQDDPFGHSWNRQNSLAATMKEWDIPFEDLHIRDVIGKGRIGTVYKGLWHGDVAIKVIETGDNIDNDAHFAAFKLEIGILRKTRHENLVLFMGACMKPPMYAIVTSFCKGETLYTMIHSNKNTFKINKAITLASQIAQGMSYLHARGIIHKDLRTKNIFLDSGRVVITDFGLFHVTKLCRGTQLDNGLNVPKGWLCYLAPEIIRSLQAMQQSDLSFTEMSDLYAFGTVWYELLCNEWPFRGQPCETVIWQVGRGIKQCLNAVSAPREVKEILMSCWAFYPNERPDFAQIAKALERIPRTRLIRSPSHPCQLSRSSEAISLS